MRVVGVLLFLIMTALVVAGDEPELSPPEPPSSPTPDVRWDRLEAAVGWYHAASVPNTESTFHAILQEQRLVAYSKEWIAEAIAAAPTIEACLAEARRQKKLLLWYIPAVEGQHLILPHFMDRYMTLGTLSDPELAAVIQRRYVAVKLPAGGELAERYGVTAPSFMQPGLLVFTPDGKVVHRMNRINTFNPGVFRELLRKLAAEHDSAHSPEYRAAQSKAQAAPDDRVLGLSFAREAFLDGDDDEARRALECLDGKEPEVALMLGRGERLRREGRRALKHLGRARKSPAFEVEALTEIGIVHLRRGNLAAAEKALAAVWPKRGVAGLRAGYMLGIVRYLAKDDAAAGQVWEAVRDASRESVWSARASGYAAAGSDQRRGEGPLTRSMQDVRWLAPEVYQAAADTTWRRAPQDVGDIARRAVNFLLLQQGGDGSWHGLRWGKGANDNGEYRSFEMAITALCALALWDWKSIESRRSEDARRRAEAFLLADAMDRPEGGGVWVYADAYRLLYFARRWESLSVKERGPVRSAMEGWVAGLSREQKSNDGAHRHYVYQSTFVTACVTYCLYHAREVGIEVPEVMFSGAARILEAARGPDGLFGYLVSHPTVTRTPKGAASRQPLCEWVLYLCGKSTPEKLDRALDVYRENFAASSELARKSNFHIPELDSTCGYYFFHNFYPACRAAQVATNGERHRARLLKYLCQLPEIDGAFVDAGFSYGKSYGTAAALLSLAALR